MIDAEQLRRAAVRAGLMGMNSTSVAMHKLEAFASILLDEERQRVVDLLKGIDGNECDDDQGWWETSTGAEFGAAKLAKIRSGEKA